MTVERLQGTPFASGEGRIARSWRLTRAAWRVVGYDDTLKGLAVLGALAGLAGFALLLVLGGVFSGARVSRGHILLVAALLAYPLTFVSVFINTAIAAAAVSALQGQPLSTRQALAVAYGRVGRIAMWAPLAGLALVAILAAQSVVRQTFVVALYRYATTGTAEGPFTEDDLSAPFTPKRGRFLS
ncbi:MAG TPA: hypothetical protein VIC06_07525 [Solirubrobacteraceae bacterium]